MSQNYTTTFDKEDDFENAFITLLKSCGWEKEVIKDLSTCVSTIEEVILAQLIDSTDAQKTINYEE